MFKFSRMYKCVSTQHFAWGTRALFAMEGAYDPSKQTQICLPCPAGKVNQTPIVGRMYEMELVELIDGNYNENAAPDERSAPNLNPDTTKPEPEDSER